MSSPALSPSANPGVNVPAKSLKSQRRKTLRKVMTGLAFISPWIVGTLAFQVYPFFASLYYSFRDTTLLTSGEYVGFDNYRELVDDPLFWTSLRNTVYYTVASVAIGTVCAIALALLLNQRIKGQTVYRTIFYMPSIVPLVAVSVIWIYLLHPTYGLLNYGLEKLGLPTLGWFSDPDWAMPGLIIVGLWGLGNAMIIYLAGLQDIPAELYEAAAMDGASAWRRLVNITIPLLSPVILFNSIIGLIHGFQYFVEPYVITQGGPADSTMTYGLYLYSNAFDYFKMGYASAMAWILFVIIMVVTLVVMRSSSRWVFYQGR
ncbi:MAG: carbohydrate ABC transporter permease [Thermomicrobiales bacterium]